MTWVRCCGDGFAGQGGRYISGGSSPAPHFHFRLDMRSRGVQLHHHLPRLLQDARVEEMGRGDSS